MPIHIAADTDDEMRAIKALLTANGMPFTDEPDDAETDTPDPCDVRFDALALAIGSFDGAPLGVNDKAITDRAEEFHRGLSQS